MATFFSRLANRGGRHFPKYQVGVELIWNEGPVKSDNLNQGLRVSHCHWQ